MTTPPSFSMIATTFGSFKVLLIASSHWLTMEEVMPFGPARPTPVAIDDFLYPFSPSVGIAGNSGSRLGEQKPRRRTFPARTCDLIADRETTQRSVWPPN